MWKTDRVHDCLENAWLREVCELVTYDLRTTNPPAESQSLGPGPVFDRPDPLESMRTNDANCALLSEQQKDKLKVNWFLATGVFSIDPRRVLALARTTT